jgi:glycosyltransferase involved in cell wall biosynthesis
MSANPKLSICVPLYNKASAVARCLGTVLANNIDGMEVLVFDNGSTDGSSDIVRDLATRDHRIRYVRLEHTIMVQESWRMGMLHSKGDILKVQSADDELHPDFLSRMLPLLESPDHQFALCAEEVRFHNVTTINISEVERSFGKINSACKSIVAIADPLARARQIAVLASVSNTLGNIYKAIFRRGCLPLDRWKAVVMAYPMPTSYPDWDFLLRLVLNHRGQFLDEPLCIYDVTPDAPLARIRNDKPMIIADAHQLMLMVLTVLADPTLAHLRAAITPTELQQLFNEGSLRMGKTVNYTLSMPKPAGT